MLTDRDKLNEIVSFTTERHFDLEVDGGSIKLKTDGLPGIVATGSTLPEVVNKLYQAMINTKEGTDMAKHYKFCNRTERGVPVHFTVTPD